MSSFPDYDPRGPEMRGHRERLAELRQIRERIDYIERHTAPFMFKAGLDLRSASAYLSDGIANYERGIEAAYQAGAAIESERLCPQCFNYVENCVCRKGKV